TSRAPATRGAENPSGSPALRPAPLGILQVLNGSSTPGLGRAAADRLRALGYGVVAVKKAAHHYDLTTVFYQPGVEGLAGRVAAAVGATKGGLAPASLNASVPVTVVIGDDYRG
ncbi:MAG: LytR C-terminal domain-containing protein, partial [Actinomycetota bacterium]